MPPPRIANPISPVGHGTLSVIAEVTLKVLPSPETTLSLSIQADTAEAGVHIELVPKREITLKNVAFSFMGRH